MARPKPTEPFTNLGFRLPDALITRIDAYAETVASTLGAGYRVTRTDAIRVLLDKALSAEGFPPAAEGKAKRR